MKEHIFKFLILYRWLTLGNVLILNLAGAKHSSLLLIAFVAVYNLSLGLRPVLIYRKLEKIPPLLLIDLIFCASILHLTGGWESPFFLYSFSPLLLSAFLFKLKGALFSASIFSLLYSAVLYLNGYSVARAAELGRLDSLISNYVFFFLISIFCAYPSILLEKLEKSQQETTKAREEIEQIHKELEMAYKLVLLSKREIDVLGFISKGKSNKEIADSLFLAESTVKAHVSSILRKLDLKSRAEAVAYFYKEDGSKN
ncbi:MAG: response regulator transcription factor [Actinomycetota bacterium]|nr:response regulator transcription factor [Actinomycetota bacterium]